MKIKNIGVVLFCLAMISLVSCKAQKERKQIDEYLSKLNQLALVDLKNAWENKDVAAMEGIMDELGPLLLSMDDFTSLSEWTKEDSFRLKGYFDLYELADRFCEIERKLKQNDELQQGLRRFFSE